MFLSSSFLLSLRGLLLSCPWGPFLVSLSLPKRSQEDPQAIRSWELSILEEINVRLDEDNRFYRRSGQISCLLVKKKLLNFCIWYEFCDFDTLKQATLQLRMSFFFHAYLLAKVPLLFFTPIMAAATSFSAWFSLAVLLRPGYLYIEGNNLKIPAKRHPKESHKRDNRRFGRLLWR